MVTMKELMEFKGTEVGAFAVDTPFNPGDLDYKTPFGARWGGEVITITQEHLEALRSGRYIALDVEHEYVVFLKLDPNNGG